MSAGPVQNPAEIRRLKLQRAAASSLGMFVELCRFEGIDAEASITVIDTSAQDQGKGLELTTMTTLDPASEIHEPRARHAG